MRPRRPPVVATGGLILLRRCSGAGTYGELFADVRAGVEKAVKGEVPVANRNGTNQHRESGLSATQAKNDADSILARLKRDDPTLAQQVVDGEVSPNAAARQMGWRLDTSPSAPRPPGQHVTDTSLTVIGTTPAWAA